MISTLSGNPTLVSINFENPPNNPLELFQDWLEEAEGLGIHEPRSLILSTVNQNHQPSSRVVFLRSCNETGLIFATSRTSQKGRDIEDNPKVAGTLWWQESLQQINFQGHVSRLSRAQSDEIFQARTREAQCVSNVFQQSAPLIEEERLHMDFEKLLQQKDKITRPEDWYAYHIHLETLEFWHGSTNRMHKRLRYELVDGSWRHFQLQP